MAITTQATKRAWIRDEAYPVGQPAPMHLNCECGDVLTRRAFEPSEVFACGCGIRYDRAGWILTTASRD